MRIFQDYSVNVDFKSRMILILFRIGNLLYIKRNVMSSVPYYLFLIFYRLFVEWLLCVELPLKTNVGKRLSIFHGFGLVVNPKVIIGDDVKLRNGVVIGNKGGSDSGCPIIGNDVDVGANAVIIGSITIGNNVKVGAGVVVTKNLNSNQIAVSAAFRIL